MTKHLTGFLSILLMLVPATSRPAARPSYRLAFASFGPLNTDVYIADADGRNAKPFLPHSGLDMNASLSTDGRWVVFSSDRNGSFDIYRAHPDGTALERLTDGLSFDDQATLSPDGRMLAFVSTRSGQADIWLLDIATKNLTNLTRHPAGDFRPDWSPDGQWIAFSSDRESSRPFANGTFNLLQSSEVFVMKPDGSELRRITRANAFSGSPRWSPDGRTIAIYEASMDQVQRIASITDNVKQLEGITSIVTVEIRTADRSVIANGSGEDVSPDWSGQGLTWFRRGENGGLVYAKGGAGMRGEYQHPRWSADGRRMVFHKETGGAFPPMQPWFSNDPEFQLARSGIFPSYSPKGDRMVVNTGAFAIVHNALMIMKPDGSGRKVILDRPGVSALAPAWSPKGDRIVFALGSFFPGIMNRGRPLATLATVGSDGSGFRQLTEGEVSDGFPSWAPDGKRVVYRTAGAGRKGLRILNVETSEVRVLTDGAWNDNFPGWSPKRDRIAFTSNRDGDYEIYTIRPDGSGLTRLTRSPGIDAHSSWSADGEWIAFASGRGGFNDEAPLHPHNGQPYGDIYVMRADGSDVRRLTANPFEDATPTFAPR